jgi:hypothetical protein
VLVRAQPQQRRAEERPRRQVEGRAPPPPRARAPHRRLALRLVQPDRSSTGSANPPKGRDHLHRRAVHLGEGGAQRLVAADDLAQRALQRRHVQRAAQRAARGDVVGGAPRLQPVQEPEPLLRERERQRPVRPPAPPAAAPAPPRGAAPPRAASSATVGPRRARAAAAPPRTPRGRARPRAWPAASARPARRSRPPPPPAPRPAPPPRSPPAPPPPACAAPRSLRRRRASPSGAGSALRSSLPLGVSGSASSRTNAAGTMYSGSRAAGARAAPPLLRVAHHVRHQPRSPGRPRAPPPRASRTPRAPRSAASISPGSMRKPRTFTWRPAPQELQVPSARQRTRSPVRYSRAPAPPPNGSGTKRSAVSPGRPR